MPAKPANHENHEAHALETLTIKNFTIIHSEPTSQQLALATSATHTHRCKQSQKSNWKNAPGRVGI
jgi:hypothetical protein